MTNNNFARVFEQFNAPQIRRERLRDALTLAFVVTAYVAVIAGVLAVLAMLDPSYDALSCHVAGCVQ